MSYFSDIDLATLHRSRLNERIQYKLSWFNRRQKYYTPPASNQSCNRDNQKHSIKTGANRKFSADHKIHNESAIGETFISEKNTISTINKTSKKSDTNRQNNSACISNRLPDRNNCTRNLSHWAIDSTNDISVRIDEINTHNNLKQNNNNLHTKNNRMIIENRQALSGTHVSSSSVLLTSNDTVSVKMAAEQCLSGDAIDRNSHRMTGKQATSECRFPYSNTTKSDPPIEEDLDVPHRKRSGTWPRTRSLNAPSPFQQFGPCGRIMKNSAMVMQIQDPASQRLTWYKPPLAVLVIKKVRDQLVLPPFIQLVDWLIQEKHMVVWVEAAILDDEMLLKDKKFQKIKDKLVTFKDGRDDLTDRIDFIVCLGGDGTLLYASLLFQQSVPPVMAFHLGSLGFLTPFQFDNFQEQVTNVLEGHAALTLRSRLRCIIVRKNDEPSESSCEKNWLAHRAITNDSSNGTTVNKPATNILVLNEVVIDRGPSPYLCNIDLFLDGKHITSVQGDGLIVSTPTGSTAYAVAAGASMIHPSVPAIMVTPICPHSLSFRPIVVPAGVELKISVSLDSRNTSWVSFDGRNRQELLHGDSLRVTTSIYPVPSICAQDQISDWFDSLGECLHWNVRKTQKSLDELSDLTASGSDDALDELEKNFDMNINDS